MDSQRPKAEARRADFEVLYERHSREVWAVVYARWLNADLAMDLTADQVKAVVYPCTAACAASSARPCGAALAAEACAAANVLVAVTAIVESRAVPIDPPTCWETLTMAEATPLSLSAMPSVAVAMAGAKINPKPKPMAISEGRICPA